MLLWHGLRLLLLLWPCILPQLLQCSLLPCQCLLLQLSLLLAQHSLLLLPHAKCFSQLSAHLCQRWPFLHWLRVLRWRWVWRWGRAFLL